LSYSDQKGLSVIFGHENTKSAIQRLKKLHNFDPGVYILENTPPPGGDISRCRLGKKYEKVKRKRGKM
jgi:hypothetical protein